MLEGVCHHGICVLQAGQNQAFLHTKKSRFFFPWKWCNAHSEMWGEAGGCAGDGAAEGHPGWSQHHPLPPPPPQLVLEQGHSELGTAVLGDSCGSLDGEYLLGWIS